MRRVFPCLAAVSAALCLSACSRAPQQTARVFALGEKANVGHMVYTVFETQWQPQLPQQPAPRIPKNRFFLVRVSAVNGSGNEIILPDMTLEDDSGNSYTPLTNGEGIPQWLGTLRKIAPAEAAQGNVAFDVVPRHYKLRVVDETGDQAVYVDIPLSFNSEVPVTTPVPDPSRQ